MIFACLAPQKHQHVDFQGRINLKVQRAFFTTYQNLDFHGRIQLKVERGIFIKVHQILGPAPEGPRSSASPRSPKSSPGGPKSPPRPLQGQIVDGSWAVFGLHAVSPKAIFGAFGGLRVFSGSPLGVSGLLRENSIFKLPINRQAAGSSIRQIVV